MGVWELSVYVTAFLLFLSWSPVLGSLRNVTADVFGSESYGKVAAFGDFNADKQTDMFVIRSGNELWIFLADLKGTPYFNPKVKLSLKSENVVITSVVPGDYDGDSQMDVLLTTIPKDKVNNNNVPLTAVIYWGLNQTLNINYKTQLNKTYLDEPLIIDFNGDLIPDIFGVTEEGPKPLIIYGGGSLSVTTTLNTKQKMFTPHSHAFVDLTADFTADLFLTTLSATNEIQFETWENKGGNFTESTLIMQKPKDVKVVGQSVFADFDGDGQQDQLLPACEDDSCLKSAIYLLKHGSDQWVPVLKNFSNMNRVWGFLPSTYHSLSIPITLHIGDYNMDGYPDALAILKDTSGSSQQAFLLENVPCKNSTCTRMFEVHWEISDLNQIKDAEVATFFDIYEDGILDIIVLSKGLSADNYAIHVLVNNFEADAYFVKVIVLSGFCSNDCPHQVKPFGVNQPGPYIMYTTADANGYLKNASEKQIRMQEWTAIIPNSQLIVIPYPHDNPKSWSAKLYLTPSNIVLLTAIALIGVCVFILVVIGILHWQEKKADDREKRQEAHRFHFDAM
ncbi:hypothetical protein XELAEV_18022766mg [Xenopus laevis]|uniref:T-cell immunomodulatory protein TIP C2 domain-containing protein n=1 Tax=Xenopus laevis TaxID=8355 RepID=A0A974D3P2_XENLA|nr:hypothetical protein XELAEV_18022766mg [Xenopus laevis]